MYRTRTLIEVYKTVGTLRRLLFLEESFKTQYIFPAYSGAKLTLLVVIDTSQVRQKLFFSTCELRLLRYQPTLLKSKRQINDSSNRTNLIHFEDKFRAKLSFINFRQASICNKCQRIKSVVQCIYCTYTVCIRYSRPKYDCKKKTVI